MRDTNLLQLALALAPPWSVTRSEFDPEAHRLDIHIDFPAGSRGDVPPNVEIVQSALPALSR